MIRIGGALEIRQMARDARRAGQIVVVVEVALRALQTGVRAGQGEAGGGVIKGRTGPGCGAVADRAIRREPGGHVVRIGCGLESVHVARSARRIRGAQTVVSVYVALCAGHGGVRASQRPAGGGVIEGPVAPRCRVVALLTGLRESRLRVAWIIGALVIRKMARHASRIRAGQGVVPVYVTLAALQAAMRACQGESGGRVIECGAVPACGVVALLTSLGEIGLNVTGVIRVLEVRQVARDASCVG